MYKGLVGVDSLNPELQRRLNPLQEGLRVGNREFRVRDKVMQIRNDYEKEVFNGDIGMIVHVDSAASGSSSSSTAAPSSTRRTSSTTSPWPTPSRSTRPRAANTRPSSCRS